CQSLEPAFGGEGKCALCSWFQEGVVADVIVRSLWSARK
ncbi:MAG: hypothetical protein ACI835_002038, partial [Planctomycetota bacterium]